MLRAGGGHGLATVETYIQVKVCNNETANNKQQQKQTTNSSNKRTPSGGALSASSTTRRCPFWAARIKGTSSEYDSVPAVNTGRLVNADSVVSRCTCTYSRGRFVSWQNASMSLFLPVPCTPSSRTLWPHRTSPASACTLAAASACGTKNVDGTRCWKGCRGNVMSATAAARAAVVLSSVAVSAADGVGAGACAGAGASPKAGDGGACTNASMCMSNAWRTASGMRSAKHARCSSWASAAGEQSCCSCRATNSRWRNDKGSSPSMADDARQSSLKRNKHARRASGTSGAAACSMGSRSSCAKSGMNDVANDPSGKCSGGSDKAKTLKDGCTRHSVRPSARMAVVPSPADASPRRTNASNVSAATMMPPSGSTTHRSCRRDDSACTVLGSRRCKPSNTNSRPSVAAVTTGDASHRLLPSASVLRRHSKSLAEMPLCKNMTCTGDRVAAASNPATTDLPLPGGPIKHTSKPLAMSSSTACSSCVCCGVTCKCGWAATAAARRLATSACGGGDGCRSATAGGPPIPHRCKAVARAALRLSALGWCSAPSGCNRRTMAPTPAAHSAGRDGSRKRDNTALADVAGSASSSKPASPCAAPAPAAHRAWCSSTSAGCDAWAGGVHPAWCGTRRTWNRERNGGSSGNPGKGGTGTPSATTTKSGCTRTRRDMSQSVAANESNSVWEIIMWPLDSGNSRFSSTELSVAATARSACSTPSRTATPPLRAARTRAESTYDTRPSASSRRCLRSPSQVSEVTGRRQWGGGKGVNGGALHLTTQRWVEGEGERERGREGERDTHTHSKIMAAQTETDTTAETK